ncbi:MAG: YdeI/OmpD-associated family protein [Saprospiraceae bacterium]
MSTPSETFTTILDKFDSNLWGHHINVPDVIAQPFITAEGERRVVCTLNDTVSFQCALMPKGEGGYFININKKIRDSLKLKVGMSVQASLRKDESQYGLPMPEEFAELLQQDETGNRLFHALTPGKQRTLLYIIGSPKRSETRINRAIVIVEHLKVNNGKIDYKMLNQAMREG